MNTAALTTFSKIPFLGGSVIVTHFPDGKFSVRSDGFPSDDYIVLMQKLRSIYDGYYKADHRSWNFRGEVMDLVVSSISEWSVRHV